MSHHATLPHTSEEIKSPINLFSHLGKAYKHGGIGIVIVLHGLDVLFLGFMSLN